MIKKSPKPQSLILRGVVYRLIECLASMGHSSIWKLICAICACNILTVGVHLSSTPSISGPGSATAQPCTSEDVIPLVSLYWCQNCCLTSSCDGKSSWKPVLSAIWQIVNRCSSSTELAQLCTKEGKRCRVGRWQVLRTEKCCCC